MIIRKIFALLLFFICTHSAVYANEMFYDRDLKEPYIQLSDNERIIFYTPCRSGSTLVYNIFRYLFEDIRHHPDWFRSDRVIKGHGATPKVHHSIEERLCKKDMKYYLIVTVRNPIESMTSMCNLVDANRDELANPRIRNIALQFEQSYWLIKRGLDNVVPIVFRYEEFINDYNVIYDGVEDVFNVKIPSHLRQKMDHMFSKKIMKEKANDRSLPESALLPNHVEKPVHPYFYSQHFYDLCEPFIKIPNELWNYN